MTAGLDAVRCERDGDLERAAQAYERILADGDARLELLLNLSVLYWQITDPGMSASSGYSRDLVEHAAKRCRALLAMAERIHPGCTEPRFWKKYIDWADLGEPFGVDECRALLREDPAIQVPAMHLFALTRGAEGQAEAHDLLVKNRAVETARARYVVSVIEGVLKRARRV